MIGYVSIGFSTIFIDFFVEFFPSFLSAIAKARSPTATRKAAILSEKFDQIPSII